MRDRLKQLEMRARALAPAPLRTAYRIGQSTIVRQPLSPPVPQELLSGCRMFASRFDLIEALPRNGLVAELGTYKGDFARELLTRCEPSHLDIIDINYSLFDAAVGNDSRVTCHTGQSHTVIGTFPDEHFHWIYIDADHSYDGVCRDIAAAAPKVRPGGYVVFNDFAHIDPLMGRYGVHRAVTEFAVSNRWALSHFALHGAGLYDVALQRPLP